MLISKGSKYIYRYFRTILHYNIVLSIWKTYINHCLFSQTVIDKFAMYSGKRYIIEVEGKEYFDALAQKEEGFIQLSSHIGNYEIAGYTLKATTKPFNALVYNGEKRSVMRNRNRLFIHNNIRMIPIENDLSHLFKIDSVLQNGEMVSLPSDRIFGSQKSIKLNFLGKVAKFPMGPFSVATLRGLDVLAVNVMKVSKGYKIYVKPLEYNKKASRKEQIAELSEKYVNELERIIKIYPTQWFNFYEFWEK